MRKSLTLPEFVRRGILLGTIVCVTLAAGQGTLLLRLQHSTAALEINSSAPHARGFAGITTGNPGDVWHYPNSVSCLLVYGDGKYIYEKRDEQTLGKPKVRLAEGAFTPEELGQMKAILDEAALRNISSPPMPDMPDDMVAIREIEALNAQINRGGSVQEFMTVKERIKTTAASGLDSRVDNGSKYEKTLAPLMKWFKEVEKKSKSALKDAQPQYCAPMNIG